VHACVPTSSLPVRLYPPVIGCGMQATAAAYDVPAVSLLLPLPIPAPSNMIPSGE
jgi:hypothetical protein